MPKTLTTEELNQLNARFETSSPQEILSWAINAYPNAALSSSFGGESAALIHMAVKIRPNLPVLFLDTGFLFKETIEFTRQLKSKFNLNLKTFKANPQQIEEVRLNLSKRVNGVGKCCDDVKVALMEESLKGVDCWIAGLRRNQASSRKNIKIIEPQGPGFVKVHPLANWSSKEIYGYLKQHDLPFHPLWEKGYKSIGCEPCTTLPLPGQDERSGRWAGTEKTECGIHTHLRKNED